MKTKIIQNEVVAGLTTFIMIVYIIFMKPHILSSTGMDFGAFMVATCLSAAIGTLIIGIWANYPFALAPGMGLNDFFAFTVVLGMNISWQAALTAVLIDGIIFIFLTLKKLRETIVNEIPKNLKIAISAGIGFFIAFIGLTGAKIIV